MSDPTHEPLALLTTTELARILGVTQVRLLRAIRAKKLQPDFTTITLNLFRGFGPSNNSNART